MTKQHSFSPISSDRIATVDASYELKVIQQPQQARATGRSKRFTGRRTIDPPPVIQVSLYKPYANKNSSSETNAASIHESIKQVSNVDHDVVMDDDVETKYDANVKQNDEDGDEAMQDKEDSESQERDIIHHTLNPLILVASIVDANAVAPDPRQNNRFNSGLQDIHEHIKSPQEESNDGSTASHGSNVASSIYNAFIGNSNNDQGESKIKEEETDFKSNDNPITNVASNSSNLSTNSNNNKMATNMEFDNLVGTTSVVANMVSDKNLDKETSMKAVFVFSNLSVKQDGNYKLRFTLYEFASFNSLHYCDSFNSPPGFSNQIIQRGTIDSAVFKVYTAKKFPGLTTSSKLSFDLKSSGTKIKVRHSIRSGKKSQQAKLDPVKTDKPPTARNSLFSRATGSHNKNHREDKNDKKVKIEGDDQINVNGYRNPSYLSPSVNHSNISGGNDFGDTGSINSFATNALGDYLSMTPLFTTMSTSSTSSLQSAAHSFGSFFSFRQQEFSPLKLLSDVSAQQLPISISQQKEDNIIPSPPGSPKLDTASNHNTIISNHERNHTPSGTNNSSNISININPATPYNGMSTSSSFNSNIIPNNASFNHTANTAPFKTHKVSHSNSNNNLYPNTSYNSFGHHHSNSHSSRGGYGHQSQDSLSSIHTRHSNLSISTPTSLYFSTPSSHVKTLVTKRSDQYLNKDIEEEQKLAPQKKSKPDRSNQYKAAIMKIQNIIN